MKLNKSNVKNQVQYMGRWVDRDSFRVFVYSKDGKKLAKNYQEYEGLIASGNWYDSKENIPKVKDHDRKIKNGTANS